MENREKLQPKALIDPVKAFEKQSTVHSPQVLIVEFDKQLPRDNLIYNLSTHMNLKESENYVKKNHGRHAVFGSSVILVNGASTAQSQPSKA